MDIHDLALDATARQWANRIAGCSEAIVFTGSEITWDAPDEGGYDIAMFGELEQAAIRRGAVEVDTEPYNEPDETDETDEMAPRIGPIESRLLANGHLAIEDSGDDAA
jgi:hypothetical protein